MSRFTYKVIANIVVDVKVVEYAMSRSESHYDYKCKSLSQQGGLLYSWKNHLAYAVDVEKKSSAEVEATYDQLDTLAKTCEFDFGGDFRLASALNQILRAVSAERKALEEGIAPAVSLEPFNLVGLLDDGEKARVF